MTVLVVGLDFSEPSRLALEAAVALAKELKGKLVLVHALTPLPPGSNPKALDAITKLRLETEQEEAREGSAKWAKAVGKSVPVEHVIAIGRAVDLLLETARKHKAHYIVVGSHGRSGLKRAVLGSVAEAVVRNSRVPVLVVPD